jgi:CTP:molybdopterin cytidylyltransferase MocA
MGSKALAKVVGEEIVPIILAGGRSSRMGIPKPLCRFGRKRLLELVIATCRKASCASPIVVLGFGHKKILREVDLSRVKVLLNKTPQLGQISSVKLGLRFLDLSKKGFLIYPVDHPLVRAEDIRLLIKEFKRHRLGKKIFLPVCKGKKGHPVLFDISLRKEIIALKDDKSLRDILHKDPSRITLVKVNNPWISMNMNTLEDYKVSLKIYLSFR